MDSKNTDNTKFIQIAPVFGKVFAVYEQPDGEELKHRILLTALQADGEIVFLDAGVDGFFADPTESSNFLRFEFETAG